MKLTKYPNGLSSATKPNNFSLIPQNQELMGENYIFYCVPRPCFQTVLCVLLPKTQIISVKEVKTIGSQY